MLQQAYGLSLGSVVGLVTVFGISARNAILLLSDYEELVDFEGHPWTVATVQLGASERLTPILMTAILTAIGLVPLALIINLPGGEISGPLAVTVPWDADIASDVVKLGEAGIGVGLH